MFGIQLDKKQREGLAKFFYDLAKLSAGGVTVAGLMQKDPPFVLIVVAGFVTVALMIVAVAFDKDKSDPPIEKKRRGS